MFSGQTAGNNISAEINYNWEKGNRGLKKKKFYDRSCGKLKDNTNNKLKDFREEKKITKQNSRDKNLENVNDCVKNKFHNKQNEREDDFYLTLLVASPPSESTSTINEEEISFFIEEKEIQRGLSYTDKKLLPVQELKNLEPFKENDSSSDVAKVLDIDRNDPELRTFAAKVGIDIDDDDDRKPNRIFRLDHLMPSYTDDITIPNGNVIGGHYGFASEFQLKEKYSVKTFDFLSDVVKDYALFLKDHPSDDYPSVSELKVHSDQKLSKEESEKVRYYDDKYLRTHPKEGCRYSSLAANSTKIKWKDYLNVYSGKASDLDKIVEVDSKLAEILKHSQSIRMKQKEEKFFGYCASAESILSGIGFPKYIDYEDNIKTRCGPLTQDEVSQARKTGILNLSHRSLLEVPERIWSIDVVTQHDRKAYEKNLEIPVHPDLWCTFKALISLNLSYNSLTTIYPQGSALTSLRELHATNNMLEELPDDIGNLQNLIFFDLDTNSLRTLPLTFSRLKNLKELKLKRNFIQKLPETFGNLISLQKLDMSFNRMVEIPGSITELEHLENINLSFNKLSDLPKKFNSLKNLEILDISNNRINNLPSLQNMPKLIVVNATCNSINQFPDISGSNVLTELHLDGNNIKKVVTKNMKDCPLIQLTMSNNKVEAIPDDLHLVSTLVLIDFSNNNLLWLPWGLARLQYLTVLNIDSNNISNIDREILEAGSKKIIEVLMEKLIRYEGQEFLPESEKNVEHYNHVEILYEKYPKNIFGELSGKYKGSGHETGCLNCKDMKLTDIPSNSEVLLEAKKNRIHTVDLSNNNFSYVPTGLKILMPHLTELILKENCLKTIPDFIGRMNLIHLDVSSNYIDSFPLSLGSSNLKKLIARNNCFSNVPKVIYSIKTLEHLDFERNKIIEIDTDRLKNLKGLTYLNFNDNSIEKLPQGLVHLPNLKTLNVSNNLFKQPSSDVLRNGTEAILRYLSKSNSD